MAGAASSAPAMNARASLRAIKSETPSKWCRFRGPAKARRRVSELRRDGDAFLLAGVGDVADGDALHVAHPAQVVVVRASMHGAAVVPHHELVRAPAMRVDELRLDGVGDQAVDQRTAFLVRHAEDAPGVGGDEEGLSSAFGK